VSGEPKTYRVVNATRGTELADAARAATNPFSRGIGLIPRKSLPQGEGLIIRPCNSVVTFFMRFPIDVLFIDRDGVVCHAAPSLVPWRTSKIVRASKQVIELPAGTMASTGTEVGDRVEIQPA
jgi:uncharacterized membrane protein (UPF0127 family)